jgi:hypothetical protein
MSIAKLLVLKLKLPNQHQKQQLNIIEFSDDKTLNGIHKDINL